MAAGNLVLFGGLNSNSIYLDDTWTYQVGATIAPTSPVGTAAAQTRVNFIIGSSGNLPVLSNSNVLTQGASGLDFTLGTGSTCTGPVTSGQTCTVNVAFTPTAPGQRLGAVNLLDSNGNVLATAFISGVGTGPLATATPGTITTVAGNGAKCNTNANPSSPCGDGTSATSPTAELNFPASVALDGAGNLYIADANDHRIRKVSAATGLISTVAGNGTACSNPTAANSPCGDGTLATSSTAELNAPDGVAVDGAGNLYIADYGDNRIRVVSAATGLISTVAGNGTPCSNTTSSTSPCGDGTAATTAELNEPSDVILDSAGNVYISDYTDQRVRVVSAGTGVISTVAGNGNYCTTNTSANSPCGDGGAATATQLYAPEGIRLDPAGNLYIADELDNRVREVSAASGLISTVAGNGTPCSNPAGTNSPCGDGTAATAAQLHFPDSVALDAAGDLYVADTSDNRIRKVSAASGLISTVAGNGAPCSNTTASASPCGDGSAATSMSAEMYAPVDLVLDGAGNLYIADSTDNRVRKVSVAGGISFPTATQAGSPDTTDGTQTATLNNLGNLPLTISSMANGATNSASFTLGNPMTGGCSTAVSVASGSSCLLGETFSPTAASSGMVVGSLAVTDNSLNATNAVQYVPLSGTTTAGVLLVEVASLTASSTGGLVMLETIIGFSGSAAPTGAITFTVNGSSANVGTVTCKSKAAHQNCTATFDPSSLGGGSYPITVSIASDSNYSNAGGSGTLTVTSTAMAGVTASAPAPASASPAVAGKTLARAVQQAPAVQLLVPPQAAVLLLPSMVADAPESDTKTCSADSGKDSKETCPQQVRPIRSHSRGSR